MILSNKGNSYKEYLNGYDLIKKMCIRDRLISYEFILCCTCYDKLST